MRKIYSFILLMLLPILSVAQTNMAITNTAAGSYYSGNAVEKRLVLPHAAAGIQQEAMTSADAGINISVGMWLKTTAAMTETPGAAILFRMGTGNHANNNGALQLLQSSTGQLTFKSGGDNIGNTGVSATMGTASLNEWHHILLTLDSQNNLATVYVDGEQTGSSDAFGKFGYKWDDGLLQFVCIGWSGSFDELQLFNTALTADEAKAAFANARAVSSLTSLYTFDEVKAGSTGLFECVDGSIPGNDATWQNATYNYYWEGGLVSDAGPTTTEFNPNLAEGREIAPTEVTVTIMDGEGGTLTATDGENTYAANDEGHTILTGTTLTLNAVPEAGYNVIGVYATNADMTEMTEIANGGTYTVVKDIILTARYTSETYTLTLDNQLNVPYLIYYGDQVVTDLTQLMGGGAQYRLVLNVPETIALESVQLGEETLEAVNGEYTFSLDADATLKINARAKAEYTVTINQPTGGTVNVSKGTSTITSGTKVLEGTVLMLNYTKDSGYSFVSYVINGNNTTDATYTVTGDVTISAIFEEGVEYCDPTPNAGRANGANTTREDRYLTQLVVSDGTSSVTVACGGSSTPRTVYLDKSNIALTSEPGKTITITASGNGSWMNTFIFFDADLNGLDESDKVYDNYTGQSNNYAGTRTFTLPTDLAGGTYRVRYKVDWDDKNPCTFGQSGDNGDAVIDFSIIIPKQTLAEARTVTVASENDVYGSVAITNPATDELTLSTDEKSVTVKATPAEGYAFMNWTDAEGTVVSTDATYNYTGETDVELTAHFGYSLTFTVGTEGSATVKVDGTAVGSGNVFAPNATVEVTVNVPDGKELLMTLNGNTIEAEANVYIFTLEANADIQIQFVDRINRLHLTIVGNGSVEVWTETSPESEGIPAGTQLFDGEIIPSGADIFVWFIPNEGYDLGSVDVTNGDSESILEADMDYYRTIDGGNCDESDRLANAYFYPVPRVLGDLTIAPTFSEATQGIEEIGIDPADGPVEYYNLQGVRVAADNLVPGFYILRQGAKTAKVLIRK